MIGITFEGGGTRGSYQIGSYLAFLDCHIKPNGVCGTSIGAFNAAMIAAGQEKELLEFWKNADIAKLLDLEGLKDIKLNTLDKAFKNIFKVLKNKGIDTSLMKKKIDEILDKDKFYNSDIDYGLCTVQLKSLKPLYKYKKDIPREQLVDYIVASCYLPLFKMEKIIDDNYYVDGGFYDNSPVDMLINNDYDQIYCIGLKGIGRHKKRPKDIKIIDIIPSRSLGGVINLSEEQMQNNIKVGYFDTLKVLKGYDGKNYLFKKMPNWYYKLITRKIDPKLWKRITRLWKTEDYKEVVLKSLEFVMKDKDISYFKIYHPYRLAKTIKKSYNKKYFIYDFIRNLRIL